MANSRYGTLLLLIGGIQTFLVFIMWIGVIVTPLEHPTWVGANLQTSAFWLALLWSGMLILHLGYGLRSGHVQFTQMTKGSKFVIYTAAVMAIIGLLATLVLTAVFFL